MFCGFIIGFERQWKHKSAGLRTNTLVATGAAFFVLLSLELTGSHGDVTRIVAQVVTGVGFLGAGIIFRDGANVQGLTSAATIWCSAAIGSIAASGFFAEAIAGALVVVFVNVGLNPIDYWLKQRK